MTAIAVEFKTFLCNRLAEKQTIAFAMPNIVKEIQFSKLYFAKIKINLNGVNLQSIRMVKIQYKYSFYNP